MVALVRLALIGVAAVSQRLSGTLIRPASGLLVVADVLDGTVLSSAGSTVGAGTTSTRIA